METISDYTIYCTEAQTKKAFELGAKIEYLLKGIFKIPTAEQMIGWLEEQGIREVSLHHLKDVWHICIYLDNGDIIHTEVFYLSRKEATLAAIDVALEYLSNK